MFLCYCRTKGKHLLILYPFLILSSTQLFIQGPPLYHMASEMVTPTGGGQFIKVPKEKVSEGNSAYTIYLDQKLVNYILDRSDDFDVVDATSLWDLGLCTAEELLEFLFEKGRVEAIIIDEVEEENTKLVTRKPVNPEEYIKKAIAEERMVIVTEACWAHYAVLPPRHDC